MELSAIGRSVLGFCVDHLKALAEICKLQAPVQIPPNTIPLRTSSSVLGALNDLPSRMGCARAAGEILFVSDESLVRESASERVKQPVGPAPSGLRLFRCATAPAGIFFVRRRLFSLARNLMLPDSVPALLVQLVGVSCSWEGANAPALRVAAFVDSPASEARVSFVFFSFSLVYSSRLISNRREVEAGCSAQSSISAVLRSCSHIFQDTGGSLQG